MTTKNAALESAPVPVKRPTMLRPPEPTTTAERLERIEELGQRIAGYVQSMCQIDNVNGASAHAKELAIAAFYKQIVGVERQLARVHDDFQLE